MSENEKICLGIIVGAQGIKGEVRIKSFTSEIEDIDQYGTLESKDGSKKFDIKILGSSKGILRATIRGLKDRNDAEALAGTELYVSKANLPALEDEDEFYHSDLIGLDVKLGADGSIVGEVAGIYDFGAGDVLEIKLTNGKSEMIPFTLSYVPEIKVKEGYIIVETVLLNFVEDFETGEDKDEG
ncbi:MAG: ribosome maturation factor RimM [Alphaproteobacteria bacterium]|nr:ribosome maturation factor RimM [Alphaproteobacteria bacterium]